MRRGLRGELILAWAAAAVGVIGIVSALTPEFADRYDLVRGVLPPLARRRRRAWQLGVVLVLAISVAHLVKGLDFEEAGLSLLLLVALIRYRGRFDVPGDPRSVRPLLTTVLAASVLVAFAVVLDLRGFDGDRLQELFLGTSLLLVFRVLYLWFRPISERVRQSTEERRLVRELVREHGHDSLAFFSLRRDKSYFFSPTRRSFLAYRVVGGCALVSGDPIGDDGELPELLSEFRRVCHARGWRIGLVSIRGELVEVARRMGLRTIKIGDEAVVRPASFSLEGRAIRKVRQSVARLERAGYRFRVVTAADVDPALQSELEDVSRVWRGSHVERGFSMAMDDFFAEPETLFAVVEHGDLVGGFLHLVPSTQGYSLGAMRRRRETPNGLMEYLISELLLWGREQDVAEISLNFCVFADFLGDEPGRRRDAAIGRVLRIGDRIFQLERLLVFSRKFTPEWRPRYLCVEHLSDLPLVGVAYLRVESLLTPPGPWARRSVERVAEHRLSH